MTSEYDYIIIGGGPTGLTMALHLAKVGRKCLIIDENSSIGGCHRVLRVDGLFTEHGPRVYSSAYLNFIHLLKTELSTDFFELFTPYDFSISAIGGRSIQQLSFREKLVFFWPFLSIIFTGGEHLKYISVNDYVLQFPFFSQESRTYLDGLCRLTDGAGSEKYTMYQFLMLLNQNFYYKLYQPAKPNDEGLFKIWESKLALLGVDILKITKVTSFERLDDGSFRVNTDNADNRLLSCKKLLLCIPPKPFLTLINNSNMKGDFKGVEKWVEYNSYENYIPITFHWKNKLELPAVWGFPKSNWGVAFINLSNYMDPDNTGGTVMSTLVSLPENPSPNTGYPANYYDNKQDVIDEVFVQLKQSFPDLPPYDTAIMNPNVKRVGTEWAEQDTAYVMTDKHEFIDYEIIPNLFFIGTQNGFSHYNFTSMESAVTNALTVLNLMNEGICIKIKKLRDLKTTIRYVLLILFFMYILYLILRKKK